MAALKSFKLLILKLLWAMFILSPLLARGIKASSFFFIIILPGVSVRYSACPVL